MELLNGLYKLESDKLNTILRKNTGRKKVETIEIDGIKTKVTTNEDEYETLCYFTTLNKALKFLHDYHVKANLNGLKDIAEIKELMINCTNEILEAIKTIK